MTSTEERDSLQARLTELAQPRADLAGPQLPTVSAVRELLTRLDRALVLAGQAAAVSEVSRDLLASSALAACFPLVLLYHAGHPERVPPLLLQIWKEQARLLGIQIAESLAASAGAGGPQARGQAGGLSMKEPAAVYETTSGESAAANGNGLECLAIFHAAVGEHQRAKRGGAEGRRILYRLMATLDLSRDEAGRVFDVTGETVRRWERRMVEIPTEQLARLTTADAGLSRLLELFLPDRLTLAIRRPADAFGGERALDWILRGRIAQVAESYDRALMYQA